MSQLIINVGTVANDGTGDTIRGAFTNVNANFTEVYANLNGLAANVASIDAGQNTALSFAYVTANTAYDKANAANLLAYNVGVNANLYSESIGAVGNAYTTAVGLASNSYANSVGTSGNAYAVTIGTAGNNYASILVANNAVGANAWTNTVSVTITNWANSKFEVVANTTALTNAVNAAFTKANTAFQNASGTLIGNFIATGSISDGVGVVRERYTRSADTDIPVLTAGSVIIANSSNNITVNVPDDYQFLVFPNVGTAIEVIQYGPGQTRIKANSGSVNVLSSNNWANIAGQYLSATLTKVHSNTWVLTGNLKT